MARAYNFNPGPATLPLPALEEAAREFVDYRGLGLSILEMSHRSAEFGEVIAGADAGIRRVLGVPDGYSVLFLQGGASLQFAMVPMNLLVDGAVADYVDTGSWSTRAIAEARKIGRVNVAASTREEGYGRIPRPDELALTPGAAYVHITSNNTIFGTQWAAYPDAAGAPLVADMSSDFLSRPIDLRPFGIIYAGAQKNAGPAGVTIVIVRDELVGRAPTSLPTLLTYRTHIEKKSLFNTPPCFAIYVVGLVIRWIEDLGGLAALGERNARKARLLYEKIDGTDFYRGTADPGSRSRMNVTFRIADPDLEAPFIEEAAERGLIGLKGHRSVGGLRASIYNAMPPEGVERLAAFMDAFERRHA